MINIITIISFIMEGILANYLNNSCLLPFLVVTSLVVIYPLFKDKKRYFKYIFLIGIFYDIVYGNIMLVGILSFLIIGGIIFLLNYLLENNILTNILIIIVSIISYQFINYIIFNIFIGNMPFINLLKLIINSLITNITYGTCWYIIISLIKKYN